MSIRMSVRALSAFALMVVAGAAAAPPAFSDNTRVGSGPGVLPLFAEVQGVKEFSGQLIVKHRPTTGRDAKAVARAKTARERLAPRLVRDVPEVGEAIIRLREGETENSVATELLATGDYEYVHPDWRVHATAIPNDPFIGSQWHLFQIGAYTAWDITVGNPTVIVAVCDSGVAAAHPDLSPVLLPGYNAVDRRTQAEGGATDGITNHGTQVAGAAAAAGNNATGITGVGWNLRVLPVRVSNIPNDTALISDINAGARWAVDNGARVINASFSGVETASVATTGQYIRDHGGLYVWAAGNAASITAGGDLPNTIVVAATDQQNNLATFSNFGPAIDISAPGVGIYTTRLGGQYGPADGTSFAAPIVSGVLALAWSINPDLTPEQAELVLAAMATDLGAPGKDDRFGAGLANAANAVTLARDAMTQPLTPYVREDEFWLVGTTPATLDVLANDADLNPGDSLSILEFTETTPASATVSLGTGPNGRERLVYAPRPTQHGIDEFTYTAEDSTGRSDSAVVKVGVTRAATFASPVTVADNQGSAHVQSTPRFADFDGDGDLDIAVSNTSTLRTLVMVRNNGNGQFSAAGVANFSVGGEFMALGNFNGDQWVDVAVSHNLTGLLGVAFGTGAFTFGPVTVYSDIAPLSVIAHDETGVPLDLNNDGHTDLAHIRIDGANCSVVVRLNNGAGDFSAASAYAVAIQPSLVRAGDLNNDGYPDLVSGNIGLGSVSVLMNDRTGRFGQAANISTGISAADMAFADIDTDGDLDVLVLGAGYLGEPPGVRILLNNGQGGLTQGGHVGTTGSSPSGLAAADFNLDGVPDLATANLLSREIFLHLNYTQARFSPTAFAAATDLHNLHEIAAADLNADGKADLVAVNSIIGSPIRPGVRIMLNSTEPPPPPCLADFDRDGIINSQDFFDFLAAFFKADPAADINEDDIVSSQDFFDFLTVFFTGC